MDLSVGFLYRSIMILPSLIELCVSRNGMDEVSSHPPGHHIGQLGKGYLMVTVTVGQQG